jgi:peptide/nickel transport system substrate-binding protein
MAMSPSLFQLWQPFLARSLRRNSNMSARPQLHCDKRRRSSWPRLVRGGIAAILVSCCGYGEAGADPRHAIAMHGEPALPADFTQLRYANPAAPKGGRIVWGVFGTFDSLNPLIIKGISPPAIRGHVIESLMARGYDEPFTLYGLVAQTVETDAARSYVTFTLNPAARFSDGTPITPEDVIFSWQLLRDKGRDNHRTYYVKVSNAEVIGERSVRFDFAVSGDRELPLILGLMPVLAKHAIRPEMFEETSLTAPLGSGPYVIGKVDAGKSVTFVRDPNYWGKDLPINRGFWNFDEVRFDFYRDANTQFEAFKRGLCDLRTEHDPSRWQTGYDFQAMRDGRVVKDVFTTGLPKPNFFYVFNTRRPVFADIRVREAVALLFDFEWINHNLFFDQYRRTASYFAGSELSAHKRPADARERALLAPFPGAVRPDVLDGTWSPPVSDGSGRDRSNLQRALALFRDAGYELRGTALVDKRNGRPFTFEILVTREEERLAVAFASNLRRAGISVRVRVNDAVQYETRRLAYDFDMIQARWDQSLSPGNEQAFYWGSAGADTPGSRNYMGVKSPAVDAMIAALLKTESREDLIAAVRALDRVLISGHYVAPLFYLPEQWVARWTTISRPAATSLFGYLPETWWREAK